MRRFIVGLLVVAGCVSVAPVGPADAAVRVVDDAVVRPSRTAPGARAPFTALLAAPSGAAFFVPPSPIPGNPGDVIWAQPSPTPFTDIYGGLNVEMSPTFIPGIPTTNRKPEVWRVLYHTVNRAGEPRAAVAIMYVDRLKASTSKIIVSMHGWTGLGDTCGPTAHPFGGALAQGPLLLALMAEGYTIVIPEGPGIAVPGRGTTLITADSSRAILDAAWAAHVFAGSTADVVMQGHSLGGQNVLGTGGEATIYAPQLRIRGIVSLAGAGISGPGSAIFDVERVRDSGSSVNLANTVASVLAHEAAYGPKVVPLKKYLTPLGIKVAAKFDAACNTDIQGYVSAYSWKQLIRQPLPSIDPGTMARTSGVPTMMVISIEDAVVDPLVQYQAYVRLCAAGQPTYWLELPGNHGSVTGTAFNDTVVFRPWYRQVASGGVPAGSCAPVEPMVSRLFHYTAKYVANALGLTVPSGATVKMTATGDCRVARDVLLPGAAGRCTVGITVTKGAKSTSTSVALRVRSS